MRPLASRAAAENAAAGRRTVTAATKPAARTPARGGAGAPLARSPAPPRVAVPPPVAAAAAAGSGAAALAFGGGSAAAAAVSAPPLGLPSIAATVASVFEAVPDEFGADYARILGKKVGHKAINVSFKDHDALVRQLIDETKAALRDAVTRRAQVADAARAFDAAVASKFGEAAALLAKLKELHAAKEGVEATCRELREQLRVALEAAATAKTHEEEANGEIDEANVVIAERDRVIEELRGEVSSLESQMGELDAINKGLEDDKEMLTARVKQLQTQVDAATSGHASAVEAAKLASAGIAAAATARATALAAERDDLTSQLAAGSKRVAELERETNLASIELARMRSERDAALEAKARLQDDLSRTKEHTDANNASLMAAMAQINKSQELTVVRERELGNQVAAQLERINALLAEKEAMAERERGLARELEATQVRERTLASSVERLQVEAASLRSDLAASRAAHESITMELRSVNDRLAKALADMEACEGRLAVTEAKLTQAEEGLATAATASMEWAAKETAWAATRTELQASKAATEDALEAAQQELATLRESAGATEESQLTKLCEVSKEADGLRRRVRELAELKARLASAESTISRLREDVFAGDTARRALHNQLQELKGNIRVMVRVRPALPSDSAATADAEGVAADDEGGAYGCDDGEGAAASDDYDAGADAAGASDAAGTSAITCAVDGTSLVIVPPAARTTKGGPSKRETPPQRFAFDTVMGPTATQADVFAEVSHLVQSALDGYNVCIFSYGQTGSGKTHTMMGGASEAAAGLIPRSVGLILDTAAKMASQGWRFHLEVSLLEIYNEVARDLLKVAKSATASASGADGAAVTIHQDGDRVEVPGLTRVPVSDKATIDMLLARAAKRRAVAATSMNEVSSRSHQVFTLYIRGSHAGKGIAVDGSLNLCDLAGSERLARSGAEGDRKREAVAINKSLSCLTDVFTALASKSSHVPFRNSKLTQLLQGCFRGDGKTMMLVNLSPTAASAHESLCSLRFAAAVAAVELGKAKKKVVDLAAAPAHTVGVGCAARGASSAAAASTGAGARATWAAPRSGAPAPALGATAGTSSMREDHDVDGDGGDDDDDGGDLSLEEAEEDDDAAPRDTDDEYGAGAGATPSAAFDAVASSSRGAIAGAKRRLHEVSGGVAAGNAASRRRLGEGASEMESGGAGKSGVGVPRRGSAFATTSAAATAAASSAAATRRAAAAGRSKTLR